MLVLTRRHGESVLIGPDIKVTVVASTGGQVRIAIDAPNDIGIFREEIFARVASANVEAASNTQSTISAKSSARGLGASESGGIEHE